MTNDEFFLGIEVAHTYEGLHLRQVRYIKQLLCKAQLTKSKHVPTPLSTSATLSKTLGKPITKKSSTEPLWVHYNTILLQDMRLHTQ